MKIKVEETSGNITNETQSEKHIKKNRHKMKHDNQKQLKTMNTNN